jgi:hypothetical protein
MYFFLSNLINAVQNFIIFSSRNLSLPFPSPGDEIIQAFTDTARTVSITGVGIALLVA